MRIFPQRMREDWGQILQRWDIIFRPISYLLLFYVMINLQIIQGSVGELESRSPTPTPPVLEPEVPLPRPAADNTETEAEQGLDENSEQAEVEEEDTSKYIPRLLDAAGNVTPRSRDQNLEPAEWSVQNVTSFLEVRHPLC